MKKLKSSMFGLFASTVFMVNGSIGAHAQTVPSPSEAMAEDGPKMDCPMHCESWPEKLELSDDQMEKLVTLKSDYQVKNAEKKAELMTDIKKMALLITAEKTDRDAIMALNDKIISLRSELATARVNKMLDAMSIMTVKQKEEIRHHMLVHMLSQHPMADMHHHHMHEHH